jgi:hypothetical protein
VLQRSEAARAIAGSSDGGRRAAARFAARRDFARDGSDRVCVRSGRRNADAATATAGRDSTDTGRDEAGRGNARSDNTGRENTARIGVAFIESAFIDLACVDARIGGAGVGAIDRVRR